MNWVRLASGHILGTDEDEPFHRARIFHGGYPERYWLFFWCQGRLHHRSHGHLNESIARNLADTLSVTRKCHLT